MYYAESHRIKNHQFGTNNKQRLQKAQMMLLATACDEQGVVAKLTIAAISMMFEKSEVQTRRDLKALEAAEYIYIIVSPGRGVTNRYIILAGLSDEEKALRLSQHGIKNLSYSGFLDTQKPIKSDEKPIISTHKTSHIQQENLSSHGMSAEDESFKKKITENVLEIETTNAFDPEPETESSLSEVAFQDFKKSIEVTTKTSLNNHQLKQVKVLWDAGYRAADVEAVEKECRWMSAPLHFRQLVQRLEGRKIAKNAMVEDWGLISMPNPEPISEAVSVNSEWVQAVGMLEFCLPPQTFHDVRQIKFVGFSDGILRLKARDGFIERVERHIKRVFEHISKVRVDAVEVVA